MLSIDERRYTIHAASKACTVHHSTIERAIKAGRLALTADRKLTLAALLAAGFTPQESTTEPGGDKAPQEGSVPATKMPAAQVAPAQREDAGARTVRAAEDLLATLAPPLYPRSPAELRILETLRQYAPIPLSPKQISLLLTMDGHEVHRILQALAVLGTIAHPAMGLYRHKPQEVAP